MSGVCPLPFPLFGIPGPSLGSPFSYLLFCFSALPSCSFCLVVLTEIETTDILDIRSGELLWVVISG